MADNTQDEYKPVKFYADNATPKKAGFSKFQVGDSYYFCRWVDNKIAMLSQAYTGQPGRDNGIESVKKNEKLAKRYRFDTRGTGRYGFGLKAGNGQEIAISPDYASQAAAHNVASRMSGASFGSSGSAGKSATKRAAPKKTTTRKKAPKKAVVQKAPKKSVQTRVRREEDNYPPLAFYRKHTKGKKKGFEKFQGDDGEYYFTYFDNSKLALISEGYPTAPIRDVGLASVRKNMKIEKRYVQGTGADGKPGFILRAGNHKEIARSVGYGSAAAAVTGAAYLMGKRRRPAAKKTVTRSKPKVTRVQKAPVPVKTAAARPKPTPPPKPTPKPRPKPPIKKLAAGSVAVAGLGASAAKPKVTKVEKVSVPVKAAAIVAAPVAAVAVAAAAVTTPKAEPKAAAAAAAKAAPVAAAASVAAPAAAVTGGSGIWGWLKWLLLGLLALLAVLFLFKSCAGDKGSVATTAPVVTEVVTPPAMVSCWNGSEAKDTAACPAKITCWDKSFATSEAACPAKPIVPAPAPAAPKPAPKPVATIAPRRPSASIAGRICGPSSNPLFDVRRSTPVSLTRLGTNPEFGNSLRLTPNQFFQKLQTQYQTNRNDRAYLNHLAKSLGYNAFTDMNASMFTNDVLPKGTTGNLGYGQIHALQFSKLDVIDPSHLEAFKVQSANGTDVHFMKRCGNFMYVCQP